MENYNINENNYEKTLPIIEPDNLALNSFDGGYLVPIHVTHKSKIMSSQAVSEYYLSILEILSKQSNNKKPTRGGK